MFEEGVGCVVSAERCAQRANRNARRLAPGIDEGEDFAGHVVVVLRLHPAAMEWVGPFVCERIALHSVDAEDSDSPLVDVGTESADHSLTFLFPFVAHAGWECEDR